MGKIIAIGNSKGGVGKSTTAHNISVILHQLGYRVLDVDTDSQSHLTVSFGITTPEELEVTLTDLMEKVINQETVTRELIYKAIQKTNTVDLLPSTFHLDKLNNPLNAINEREYVLADILSQIKDDYDYIILDCNSSRNIFITNALACADEVIIPCQTQYLSQGGIPLMLTIIQSMKRRINPNLKFKGILLTMYQVTTNQSKETVEAVRKEYGDKVFKTIIPLSTKVPDGQKLGLSVVEYDKANPVSIAYNEFVEEMVINE